MSTNTGSSRVIVVSASVWLAVTSAPSVTVGQSDAAGDRRGHAGAAQIDLRAAQRRGVLRDRRVGLPRLGDGVRIILLGNRLLLDQRLVTRGAAFARLRPGARALQVRLRPARPGPDRCSGRSGRASVPAERSSLRGTAGCRITPLTCGRTSETWKAVTRPGRSCYDRRAALLHDDIADGDRPLGSPRPPAPPPAICCCRTRPKPMPPQPMRLWLQRAGDAVPRSSLRRAFFYSIDGKQDWRGTGEPNMNVSRPLS